MWALENGTTYSVVAHNIIANLAFVVSAGQKI